MNFEILFDLERQLLDPKTRSNTATLNKLLSAEFVEFGSSGTVYNRTKIMDALTKEISDQIMAHDFKAAALSDNVVLVTYISTHENKSQCLRSSVWKRTDKQWQMVFHQGTIVSMNL